MSERMFPDCSALAYNQATSLQRPLFAGTHPQGAGERLLDRADAHVAHLRPTKKARVGWLYATRNKAAATFRAALGNQSRRKRIRFDRNGRRPKRTIWTFRTIWTMYLSSQAETVMAPSNTQKHARAPVALTRSAANDIAAVLIKHNPTAPKA